MLAALLLLWSAAGCHGALTRPPEGPARQGAGWVIAEVIRTCAEGSVDGMEAAGRIRALGAEIEALAPAGNHRPLVKGLFALLDGPCFELARHDAPERRAFRSALTLKAWWKAGGDFWLERFTKLPSTQEGMATMVVVPPDPLLALTLDGNPGHPLGDLLCRAGDEACGRETAGWMCRASRDLGRLAALEEVEHHDRRTEEECRRRALRASADDRFDVWRGCIADTPLRTSALPLGSFRAPKTGWLLLVDVASGCTSRSRRFRALDLGTGAAYSAEESWPSDPAVDGVRVGRVAIDALREAALIVMLAAHASERVLTSAASFALPDGIDPVSHNAPGWRLGGRGELSSDLRDIDWAWLSGNIVKAHGRLSPLDADADRVADDLLAAADSSFEAGPTPAPAPETVGQSPGWVAELQKALVRPKR